METLDFFMCFCWFVLISQKWSRMVPKCSQDDLGSANLGETKASENIVRTSHRSLENTTNKNGGKIRQTQLIHGWVMFEPLLLKIYRKDRLRSSGELSWPILVLQLFDLLMGESKTPHFYDFGTFGRVHEPQNQLCLSLETQDT